MYRPRSIFAFFLVLAFWFLLSGNFSLYNLILGTAVSLVTVVFFRNYLLHKPSRPLGIAGYTKKFFLLVIFTPVFVFQAYKASLQVIKLIIFPSLINPGIVEIKTDAPTVSAVSMLANLITLTPGTLTMDYNDDKNTYYIHWIQITTHDSKEMREIIIGAFEPWIDRIFG